MDTPDREIGAYWAVCPLCNGMGIVPHVDRRGRACPLCREHLDAIVGLGMVSVEKRALFLAARTQINREGLKARNQDNQEPG